MNPTGLGLSQIVHSIAAEDSAAAGGVPIADGPEEQPTTAAVPADIEFHDVSKHYGDVKAVDGVSFAIAPGSFHSLLGPSGCGKTTSLRLMAGFEQPTRGDVSIGGASVNGVPPYRRPVNMVFQHYALFPHLDVRDNVGYGLKQRKPRPSKAEIAKRVDETLELVRLSGLAKRRAWELSGGQQQRVALARALINRPTVLLLDEPLAALDRKLRREMQMELQSLQREVGITFVLVTHDQEEALSMSDSIAIMRDGEVVQSGSPRDLYDQPANLYVADFVGKSNFIAGSVTRVDGRTVVVEDENGKAFVGLPSVNAPELSVGAEASIAIRPELIVVNAHNSSAADMAADVAINGRVKNRIFLGEHTEYLIDADGLGDILVLSPKHVENQRGGFELGDSVALGWKNETALALENS